MNSGNVTDQVGGIVKKWWFSIILVYPIMIVTHQFWLALARNILQAVNYDYPGFLYPFMFVLKTVTLFIHEAGHTFFSFFGWRFLEIAVGSGLQILMPFLVFISAWRNNQKIVAQFFLFWLGFSWMDTAAYCADAKFQNLPLIGNLPKSAHDFTNMLNMTGILDHYRTIAWIFFGIGFMILILAILWPLFSERKESSLLDLGNELEQAGLDT